MPPNTGLQTFTRAQVFDAIRRYWGFDTLRPMQEEAIRAGLQRRDSLVVMPTGGGKSLCYQVPPLLTGAPAIVVSPLISLMNDQVDSLRVAGYPAAALHSNLSADDIYAAESKFTSGQLRLLFVAPERLFTDRCLTMLTRAGIESIAVDEAHCISQWGHDFRPEYRRLATLRERFPGAAFHAYTATATPRVREDIAAQLRLRDPAILVGCFDRPNLAYRVLPRIDLVPQIADALERHAGRAAIVYCISRKDTEALAAALSVRGIDARAYHAGLDGGVRHKVASDFRNERLNVVVATVAFGMGIDRGDVRCVIHAAMPKTVEHYQQETGRAGRDGLPAECVLFYSAGDVQRWKRVMEMGAADNAERGGEGGSGSVPDHLMVQFELLDQMQRLCAGSRCRHRALSEYFGQAYEKRSCDACDVCLDELEAVPDSTEIASKILSCVARVKQSFGAAYIIDVLRGRSTAKVKDRRHDELSTFGILSEVSKETLGAYINQLTDDGGLAREGLEFPILRLNERSVRILKGQETVTFRRPRSVLSEVAPSGPGGVPLSPAEMSLFESLRALRRNIAEELGVPPFAVFADTTLEEMSKVRPASGATLVTIKGIGQVKLAEFGERFLTHIREYGAAHGLALDAARGSRNRSDAARDRSSPGRAKQPRGRGASGPLYAAGKSIDEVATALGIVRNTAAAHLSDYILSERPESIETWVPPDVYAEVAAAVAKFPGNLLRPIFEFLGEAVPYEQIRLVVNHLQVVQDRQAGKPAALP